MSPLRIWRRSISPSKCGYQFPQWWIFGASESKACADVEQRGALLEADLDRVDRLGGALLALRGHERDRLAEVAHLVLREQRLVGRDPECREVPVLEQRDVLPGDHRVHAGHRLGLATCRCS